MIKIRTYQSEDFFELLRRVRAYGHILHIEDENDLPKRGELVKIRDQEGIVGGIEKILKYDTMSKQLYTILLYVKESQ